VTASDGIDANTRVCAARGAWVSVVLSYHARHSMMLPLVGPTLLAFPSAESPQVWLLGTGYALCRVVRSIHSEPTGGEILLVRAYCDEMEEWVVPRSNSF
jgi:hypothetical protein